MTVSGVDIAWARPTTASIKAAGAHFVARYLSPDSSKNITKAEVQDYTKNGIAVVVVWESVAGRMKGGYAAGKADAHSADIQRAAVGLPNNTVIYFACDFDAQSAQYHAINEYMRGANDVIGLSRSGVYGGYYVVNNVAAAPARAKYFWQTLAWSDGKISSHANIYQSGGTALGGKADLDTSETPDYGQYPRPAAVKTVTKTTPKEIELTPEQVWAYENKAVGDEGDMHAYVTAIKKSVDALTTEVAALKATLSAIATKVGA